MSMSDRIFIHGLKKFLIVFLTLERLIYFYKSVSADSMLLKVLFKNKRP